MGRPEGAGIRELCESAGCTDRETEVVVLLADNHTVDSAAAVLLISPRQVWRRREGAKRKIRERYGIDPADTEYYEAIEQRRRQALTLRSRGHSDRYIGDRLGISHVAVIELLAVTGKRQSLPNRIEGPFADADEPAEPFSAGGSRTDPIYRDHWPSSTGIDPMLEPGTPGGPPVYPVTTRKISDDG